MLTEFDKKYFYAGNRPRVVAQGEHLRLTINADNREVIAYIGDFKGVVKGDFILMHPTSATADALSDILQYYKDNGLEMVTISENLQNEG